MPATISHSLLAPLSALLASRLGLRFPRERWASLERAVQKACPELGFSEPDACVRKLLSSVDRGSLAVLASHLTVGETFFFREPKAFAFLENDVIPEWVRRKADRRVRAWVAGCSSGEEAWSLAILFRRCLPGDGSWDISIIATDVNPRALERAREAVYDRWSFRGTDDWVRDRYFVKEKGDRLQIRPEIRGDVEFSCLNLAQDPFPSLATRTTGLDLIMCRNVLMYFTRAKTRAVIRSFHDCLVDGGWLLLGTAETPLASRSPLHAINWNGEGFFYRREDRPAEHRPGEEARWGRCREHRPGEDPRWQYSTERRPGTSPPEDTPAASPARKGPAEGARKERSKEPGKERCMERGAAFQEALQQAVARYRAHRYADAEHALRTMLAPGSREPQARVGNPPAYGDGPSAHGDGPPAHGEAPDAYREEPPAYGEACALLARTLANRGDLEEALAWSERSLAREKLNPSFQYLRALILQELHRPEEAAASLRRVLYLDPGHALAHYTLGSLLARRGKRTESLRHLGEASELVSARSADAPLEEIDGITAAGMAEIIGAAVGSMARGG